MTDYYSTKRDPKTGVAIAGIDLVGEFLDDGGEVIKALALFGRDLVGLGGEGFEVCIEFGLCFHDGDED